MPPNKPKLYTTTGKSIVRPTVTNNIPQAPISMDSEQAQKFEVELCWCIQQLQLALSSTKLNNKQSQDQKKSLNTLMSNNAPMIKKRQIMRSTFGDYRKKMADEEKRISKNALHMKMKPAEPDKKSVFVKKRVFSSSVINNFKFNFEIVEDCNSNERQEEYIVPKQSVLDKNTFSCPDKSFRFNFDVPS